jgi:outer membrane protein TolC
LGEQNPQNPRVRIQLAKKTSDIAFQQVRRGLSTTISQVEVAYWNLYSALEVKKLREESLKVAKDIYEDNKERFRLGKMAKLELLESESEIAEREAYLEDAIKRLYDAKNELNTYFSESLICSGFFFIPIDEPQVAPVVQSCEEIVADSLLNHPEYLIRKEQAELEGLKLAYAKNQRLPQLDLTLSYGFNGLGLTATEAWEQVQDKSKADWLAGVQLNIPLMGDRKAYRQMSAAKRRKQQALMNLKSVEVQIMNLTITTYNKLKSNFNVYQKASQVVDFREELLEAELAKLEEGKSSTRQVFEIESDLSDSKIAKLAKMVEYQKTQIELLLFQGTFLEARNIDISEDQLLN